MASNTRPRVFARFTPEPVDAKVFADFGPERPTKAVVYATFDPESWEKAQEALRDISLSPPLPAQAQTPPVPAIPSDPNLQLLFGIQSLLAPDNYQVPYKFVTSQVLAGYAYDYPIPPWTRHLLLTNTDTLDAGASGQLYYWYDNPWQGAKVLPQQYSTLLSGQSLSENSQFKVLTVFANASAINQGWELRFSGRPADALAFGLTAPVGPAPAAGGVSSPGGP